MKERKKPLKKIMSERPTISLETILVTVYDEVDKVYKSRDPYAESMIVVPDNMVLSVEDFIKTTNAYEDQCIEYSITKYGEEEIKGKVTNIIITPKCLK